MRNMLARTGVTVHCRYRSCHCDIAPTITNPNARLLRHQREHHPGQGRCWLAAARAVPGYPSHLDRITRYCTNCEDLVSSQGSCRRCGAQSQTAAIPQDQSENSATVTFGPAPAGSAGVAATVPTISVAIGRADSSGDGPTEAADGGHDAAGAGGGGDGDGAHGAAGGGDGAPGGGDNSGAGAGDGGRGAGEVGGGGNNDGGDDNCPLCQELMQGQPHLCFPCHACHRCHHVCAEELIRETASSDGFVLCPYCRAPVAAGELRQLMGANRDTVAAAARARRAEELDRQRFAGPTGPARLTHACFICFDYTPGAMISMRDVPPPPEAITAADLGRYWCEHLGHVHCRCLALYLHDRASANPPTMGAQVGCPAGPLQCPKLFDVRAAVNIIEPRIREELGGHLGATRGNGLRSLPQYARNCMQWPTRQPTAATAAGRRKGLLLPMHTSSARMRRAAAVA